MINKALLKGCDLECSRGLQKTFAPREEGE